MPIPIYFEGKQFILRLTLDDLDDFNTISTPPPSTLYHYTDISGAAGIITSRSLRCTKLSYLNDTSELKHAIEIFKGLHRVRCKENRAHSEFLDDTIKHLDNFENINICVVSFCEDSDLLSQWRGYSRNSTGIALGFNAKVLKQVSEPGARKCIYDKKTKAAILGNLYELLRECVASTRDLVSDDGWTHMKHEISRNFYGAFLRIACLLKDHRFQEEKEWRIVTIPISSKDPRYKAILSNVALRVYYEMDFSPSPDVNYDFLNEIMIGPCQNPKEISEALSVLAERAGCKTHTMRVSNIPFRP